MSSNSITLTAPSPRTVVSAIAVYAVLREVYHVYQSTLRAISTEKFCGGNDVQLSRGPVGSVWGKTSTVLLMVNKAAGTPITRATLMTLLSVTNARQVYSYSSAAGHHSSYISYCGVWDITWPLGQKCTVNLAPHDVHTQAADVYPDTFPARVDRCIEMLSGIVSFSESKVAFPGRAKSAGRWILEEVRGFPGAGELYNKMGGKVFLLDSLALKPVFGDLPGESSAYVELSIPCLGQIEKQAKLFVRPSELKTLAKSLDYLPWGRLSWSVHRGMKDLLVAFGKKIMDVQRKSLALTLERTVFEKSEELIANGWDEEFVRGPMPGIVSSSVMVGGGTSGDMVRAVVATAETFCGPVKLEELDHTRYWSKAIKSKKMERQKNLDPEAVAALTKFFVLEWSTELDYHLYDNVPTELYLS